MELAKLERTFIIAEIGINHNGSKENILKMIDVAADAGANAVKLQVMTGYDLVSPELEFEYKQLNGEKIKTKLADLFYEMRVKKEWLEEIYNHAKKRNIICLATPFSKETIDILETVDNPIYKISSGDITHTPLIEYAAKTDKPIIISTGKSSLSDIDRAVQAAQMCGNDNIALLHCVSVYPTPIEELNLNLINSLSQTFSVPVGFSDHSEGFFTSATAVAMGAKIVEKHFTLDKNMEGPDHWFSLNPEELRQLVAHIRAVEHMAGTSRKAIYNNELKVNERASRSIVANKDLKKGHVLTLADFDYLRPGTGLRPYQSSELIGKKIKKDINKKNVITLSDIEW